MSERYDTLNIPKNWGFTSCLKKWLISSADKVAPNITCPQNPQITLRNENVNPDYIPEPANATDDITADGEIVIVTEPAVVTGLTAQNVSEFISFKATATDQDGNSASCQYTIQVQGA